MEPKLSIRRYGRLVQPFQDGEELSQRWRSCTKISESREKESLRSAVLFEAAPRDWMNDVVWDVFSKGCLAFVFTLSHFCGLLAVDDLVSSKYVCNYSSEYRCHMGDNSTSVQVTDGKLNRFTDEEEQKILFLST